MPILLRCSSAHIRRCLRQSSVCVIGRTSISLMGAAVLVAGEEEDLHLDVRGEDQEKHDLGHARRRGLGVGAEDEFDAH